jgi:hypothetical protein
LINFRGARMVRLITSSDVSRHLQPSEETRGAEPMARIAAYAITYFNWSRVSRSELVFWRKSRREGPVRGSYGTELQPNIHPNEEI